MKINLYLLQAGYDIKRMGSYWYPLKNDIVLSQGKFKTKLSALTYLEFHYENS